MKIALIAAIIIVASAQTAFACVFAPQSANAAYDPVDGASCLSVPEASDLGKAACTFLLSGVENLTLSGQLSNFNELKISEDKSVLDINVTNVYVPIVDTADPNVVPEGIISCISTTGETKDIRLIIKIFEENTQNPKFEQTSYVFDGVPETLAQSVDFTTIGYGSPIHTTDKDNSAEGEHDSNVIIYKLEDDFGTFNTFAILENSTWPYEYRASLILKNKLNYNIQSSYTLKLTAFNKDNNPQRTSTVDVIINLRDSDNLDPLFTLDEYIAYVTQEMLTYVDIYTVPIDPPIKAHDQDKGINATVTYAIDYNCGETEVCEILTTNFRIEPIEGTLIFDNKEGLWTHTITEITFTISATQVDNPDRVAYANVTAYFDLPPTPPPALNKCQYIHVDDNSVVDDANRHLYCKIVNETTSIGEIVCNFLVLGATSASLHGLLSDYNLLPNVNSGNGSILINLYQTKSYSDIVDKSHPNMNPTGTVQCVDVDGASASIPITVRILQENTHDPIFEKTSYTYLDVPQDLPPGIDFTTYLYGDPIFATDADNNDLDPIPSNLIEYEIDPEGDYTDLFHVQSILVRQEYTKRFRAAISLQKPFGSEPRLYHFALLAKNSVPNVNGDVKIYANVTVGLNALVSYG